MNCIVVTAVGGDCEAIEDIWRIAKGKRISSDFVSPTKAYIERSIKLLKSLE